MKDFRKFVLREKVDVLNNRQMKKIVGGANDYGDYGDSGSDGGSSCYRSGYGTITGYRCWDSVCYVDIYWDATGITDCDCPLPASACSGHVTCP